MDIRKVVWASALGALSIIIDMIFKLVVPLQTMGTPYYAIPIIVAGIFLGPKYSILVAFLGDLVSTTLAGDPYFIMFSIGSTLWGVIPGLLLYKKEGFKRIIFVVLITHIIVTLMNSYALYYHFHKSISALLIDLPLRAGMIIPNTLIISLLVEASLEPIKIRRNDSN